MTYRQNIMPIEQPPVLPEKQPHKDRIWVGIASVCVAFFLITTMLMLGKLLAGRHGAIEVVFYRNLIGILPMALFILARRRTDLLRVKKPKALLFRVVAGTMAIIPTFAAMQILPMANATVIFFTSTLIVPVLAHFALKEKIGMHRWLAVLFGMTGVFLIAQPSAELNALGVVLALCAACGHAVIQTMLRYLREESSFTVTFYFLLGGVIFCGLFMPFIGKMPTPDEWLIILALGGFAGIGQYLLSFAFKNAPASLLSPFNYTGLIWSTGFDILIWHHVPGWPVFAGSAVIICSKLYIIYRERQIEKRTAK